jgi:hypothetical protein
MSNDLSPLHTAGPTGPRPAPLQALTLPLSTISLFNPSLIARPCTAVAHPNDLLRRVQLPTMSTPEETGPSSPANASAAAPDTQTETTAPAAQAAQAAPTAPTAQGEPTEQATRDEWPPAKPEIFGPDDWDMIHVNPRHIEPVACVRPVRRGDDGLTNMYESIKRRWDVMSMVVL